MSGAQAAATAPAPLRAARRRFVPEWARVVLANGKARTGLTILGFLIAVSIAAPWLRGSGTVTTEVRAAHPSWRFPFGTTNEGFDVMSQVLRGGRLTLLTVAGATLLAMLMAVTAGLLAGTFGGWVDAAVSSVTNGFLVIPMLPMALLVAGILPRSQHTTAATIGMIALATWAAEARVLRSQALSLRERDFVAATEVVGEHKLRIAFTELLPCMASRIAAGFFFVAIQSMVVEATLDYLAALSRGRFSLGDVGGDTWASTLANAQDDLALFTGTWWHFFFPAAALLLLGTGLVLTMHGLEELADPRLRGGRRLRLCLPRLHLPRRHVRTTPTVVPTPMPRVPLSERLDHVSATLLAIVRVLGRRLPLYAVALWFALTVCYALPQLTSRAQSARDPQPLSPAGYPHFLATVLTGHVDQNIPGIAYQLRNSLPFSLALVAVGVGLAFLCGITLGAIAGWRRGGLVDTLGTTGTAALWALPGFVAAGLGLYFLGLQLGWFPLQFAYDVTLVPAWSWQFVGSAARHAELPVLILFISSVGYWALNMRNVMTSVASEEYIQLARVKGLSERTVMWRYAGRNALLPVITGFAVAFGLAIGGIPAIEAIFSYQGGGWQLQQAAMNGNFPLEQGIFICIVAFALVVNLLADVVQVVLDPRLR